MHEYSEPFLQKLARRYAIEQLAFLLGYRDPVGVPAVKSLSRDVVRNLMSDGYLEPKIMGDRSVGWTATSKAFEQCNGEEWHERDFLGKDYRDLVSNVVIPTPSMVKMVLDIRAGRATLVRDEVGNHWCRKVAAPQIDPDDRMLIVKALRLYGNYCDMFGGEQGEFAGRRGDRAIALADKIAAGEVVC